MPVLNISQKAYRLFFAERRRMLGFTIIELMLVIGALGVLSAIAVPSYRSYVARAEMAQVILDMSAINTLIKAYEMEYGKLPDTLDEIG